MTTISLLAAILWPPIPIPIPYIHPASGYLSAYQQAPTDAVIEYRLGTGQLPDSWQEYDGLIAVYECWRIGDEATLHTIDGDFDVIIFDCAGDEDGGQEWMIEHDYVAEIDWYFWQENPGLIGSWVEVEYK